MWNKHLRFNVELSLRLHHCPPKPPGKYKLQATKQAEARNKSHLNDAKEEECRVNWSDKQVRMQKYE